MQYYTKIPELDTPYKVNMFIDKKMSNLLSENGVIIVDYGFEVAALALKKKLGMEIPTQVEPHQFLQNIILAEEQKHGIVCQLLSKWDSYSYDFIDGVEKNSQNVIISYRKK